MILFYRKAENLDEQGDGLKECPRLEISYSGIDIHPRFAEDEFTYAKFIEKKNGKLFCRESYKGYALNDHLLNN